ncbi:hypothetical protein MAC_02891 [Metarhizium acridum CQMa 102]|uniref:Uncharacterized protein n=1 Tax=Metarhizium acridum (strain CQMa 102) TaxID=655827 RepID=E9DZ43_METAQ|nr:uncharacterized protein MAC_02891 [Metarhizium acridum CQMa 102]EFY91005.1 hypothetical protein MAC_02891 [Metarhizium acridum CQMa 102]
MLGFCSSSAHLVEATPAPFSHLIPSQLRIPLAYFVGAADVFTASLDVSHWTAVTNGDSETFTVSLGQAGFVQYEPLAQCGTKTVHNGDGSVCAQAKGTFILDNQGAGGQLPFVRSNEGGFIPACSLLPASLRRRKDVKNVKDFTKVDWVLFCQLLEKLGGSDGVLKAINGDDRPINNPNDFPSLVPANLNATTLLLATLVNINTTDGHVGAGWGIGFGAGIEVTAGVLGYTSWDELMSADNTFSVVSIEDGVAASFWIGDKPVAGFLGTGIELDVSISGGTFTWSQT